MLNCQNISRKSKLKIIYTTRMKKLLILSFVISSFVSSMQSQSMDKFFRKPLMEEGDNNIILQNRCGNRLTLMFKPDNTDLEFTYKPNAYRRKEFWARNFSNRDNQTVLFTQFSMPDIRSVDATYDYDPFVTRVKINSPSLAKNNITVVNIADENAFVISARSPLLLAIKPHVKFEVKNGLLTEKFSERGEDIVSFIKFDGFEQNRFRILADGTYILQIVENDVLIVGGEENMYQVDRVCQKFENYTLAKLIERNEAVIKPELAFSHIYTTNPDFNKVLDMNKRILYSMTDEGGATFGALSRTYYLMWVRDGSMASSLMARSGFPTFTPKWTELTLNSPSIMRRDDGTEVPEFSQVLGTRWSKSEDDGIFYAALSMFSNYQTTGDTKLLHTDAFKILIESIDRFFEKTWDKNRMMIGSDTRGETSLKSSPYYGYDVVNGEMYHNMAEGDVSKTTIVRSFSLYNQVNSYNLMLMTNVLLSLNPAMDNGRSAHYKQMAHDIKETINKKFRTPTGTLYSGFELFSDGSEKWVPFGKESDYWETAWASSLGPYFPLPDVQLASVIEMRRDWEKYRNYGYCPWNTLSRSLYEYGMSSTDYEKMLSEQIKDALTLTKKYPMKGAVTEYQKEVNGWRALPFQIGSLYYSLAGQILYSMPFGIGVRASNFVDIISDFKYKLSMITAKQVGDGDVVESYSINAKTMLHSLQIPSNLLRNGLNNIEIKRTKKSATFRLYSSTAELLDCHQEAANLVFEFENPVVSQLVFENADKAKSFKFTDKNGIVLPFTVSKINEKTLIELETAGDFKLEVQM
jgi:hypothetical protein